MLIITLSACSAIKDAAISAINPFDGDSGGLEVSSQIGKTNVREEVSSVGVSTTTENKAETINQTTTNNINVEPWLLLLIICLAAGGAIGWVDNIVRIYRRK